MSNVTITYNDMLIFESKSKKVSCLDLHKKITQQLSAVNYDKPQSILFERFRAEGYKINEDTLIYVVRDLGPNENRYKFIINATSTLLNEFCCLSSLYKPCVDNSVPDLSDVIKQVSKYRVCRSCDIPLRRGTCILLNRNNGISQLVVKEGFVKGNAISEFCLKEIEAEDNTFLKYEYSFLFVFIAEGCVFSTDITELPVSMQKFFVYAFKDGALKRTFSFSAFK